MRKKAFKITDKALISAMLHEAGHGVLALAGKHPYAVPVNFVWLNDAIYFHSSPKGKKMRMIHENPAVSFSVVLDETIIPSYFSTIKGSSTEGMACPASAFFKSVIIDGTATLVESRDEIAQAFTAMMEKLQPEGSYTSFDAPEYDKHFTALAMVRIDVKALSAKFKFGQNLNAERFEMVLEHLEQRGSNIDLLTTAAMRQLYGNQES